MCWLLVWAGCLVSIRFSCNCGVKEGDFAGAFCLHGEVNGRCCLHSISRSCVLCLFANWSLVLEVGRSQYKVQEVCDLTTWVGQDCFQWWYIIPTKYSLYLFHHFSTMDIFIWSNSLDQLNTYPPIFSHLSSHDYYHPWNIGVTNYCIGGHHLILQAILITLSFSSK